MRIRAPMFAALAASLLLALLFLMRGNEQQPAVIPAHTPEPAQTGVSSTATVAPTPTSEPGRQTASREGTAIRDLELALEAAVMERAAAEAEVERAAAGMEAAEAQIEFRLDQGEAPDSLAADATALLEAPFDTLQDALRRLDQARASETSLRRQLERARGD